MNIVCIQETWHKSLKEINNTILLPDKKIFHSTATKTAKKGRYSGGLIFIVENNLKSSGYFPSDRIGVLSVGKNSIIQVYLPFYDGKDNTVTEYSKQLDIISKTIRFIENNNKKVIIVGDFNCDFSNNAYNLIKTMNRHKLVPLDIIFKQNYDFTYWKILSTKVVVSWPDHVFGNSNNQCIKTVKLLSNDNNFGDHRAIAVELRIDEEESNKVTTSKKNKLEWNNGAKTNLYTQQVNFVLTENYELIMRLSKANNRDEATELLNAVYSLTVNSLISAGKMNLSENSNNHIKKP